MISQRVNSLSPSATFAMSQKAADLRATGLDVISLSVGEPDFNTPDHIKKAAKDAIDNNFSFYTPVPGYLSLREAVCRKLKRENGLDYTPAQIIVGNGAKQELCDVLLSIVDKGDEVIIPTPAWVSYFEMVKIGEGVPVAIYAGPNQGFKVTPAQLEAAITPKTKAVMICSPSNPSGAVYSREELAAIVEVLAKYPRIIVISDEIYEHITYVGKTVSIASFPGMYDRTVVINGVSKAYAMTGWRIGYCAAPLPIAKAVSKLHGQYTSNCSSIAQKAAEAAYDGPQQCVEDMRVAFERRRDLIVSLAKGIHGFKLTVPDGAFYIFPEVKSLFGRKTPDGKVIANADDLAMYLLEKALVASVSGASFGAPDCIRFSYATADDKIVEAMRRVRAAVEALA